MKAFEMTPEDALAYAKKMSAYKCVTVDGPADADFDGFATMLNKAFVTGLGILPLWWNVSAAQGKSEKLSAIRPDPSAALNILFGHGASAAGWDGLQMMLSSDNELTINE